MLANHVIDDYTERLLGCTDPVIIREILHSVERLSRRETLTTAAERVRGFHSCGTYYDRCRVANALTGI